MTCIVALKDQDGKIVIAGERQATDIDNIVILSTPKVWQHGNYIFGFAGTMEGERFKLNFEPPMVDPEIVDEELDAFMNKTFAKAVAKFYDKYRVDTSKDAELCMLIGINGKIYEHNASDMTFSSYASDYMAIGSGAPYALGVLYANGSKKSLVARAQEAVEAAILFSSTCGGTIDIISSK